MAGNGRRVGKNEGMDAGTDERTGAMRAMRVSNGVKDFDLTSFSQNCFMSPLWNTKLWREGRHATPISLLSLDCDDCDDCMGLVAFEAL